VATWENWGVGRQELKELDFLLFDLEKFSVLP
jgi:hypothetical protein